MPLPPTGQITVLFTAIKGTVHLWAHDFKGLGPASDSHDKLLRECIESHEGVVFQGVGSSFCAAFPKASLALEAALSAPLPVMMALHTGSAEERGGSYFGPAVDCVAELLDAGYGGQVLLSDAAQKFVRGALPAVFSPPAVRPERRAETLRRGLCRKKA